MNSNQIARKVESRVYLIRGHRVLLSNDLAELYGVSPGALVQAVKRQRQRFPPDFMFQLTAAEHKNLKSQSVISNWGGARTTPYAFTEQGIAMLSSVLRSARAVRANIAIMRAFVDLRRAASLHADLARRLDTLERRYDSQFQEVFAAIREVMSPPEVPRRRIGFKR